MNKVVFIVPPHDHFTPERAGSIAICTFECAKAAIRDKLQPIVLARQSDTPPFPSIQTYFYPPVNGELSGIFGEFYARAERKIFGYSQTRHPALLARLIDAIKRNNLAGMPIIYSCDPEIAVRIKQRFPSSNVLCWIHSTETCKPGFREAMRSSGTKFAAVSLFEAGKTGRNLGLNPGMIKVAYNGVDHAYFFPADTPANDLPLINFHGRTAVEKGPDILLKAAILNAHKGIKFRMQIIGSHTVSALARPAQERYELSLLSMAREINSFGIEVTMPGRIPNDACPITLRQAHINVVPSRWEESFGLSTLEGMACGLATVASNVGGTPEVVGDAGLLFERENVEQLAAHLELLIKNPALRSEFGHRAYERSKQFNWDRSWRALREVIEDFPPEH